MFVKVTFVQLSSFIHFLFGVHVREVYNDHRDHGDVSRKRTISMFLYMPIMSLKAKLSESYFRIVKTVVSSVYRHADTEIVILKIRRLFQMIHINR